nr:hypothetical protein [Streptomyces sp. S10(2018)]
MGQARDEGFLAPRRARR